MREIKFRAWDKEKKEMVYDGECDKTEGWYGTDSTHLHVGFSGQISGQIGDDGGKNGLHEHDADIPRDRFILMLSTGKRDIHKTDIYRGDILRKGDITATVEWDEVYLCWKAEAKDGVHRLWPASWHMCEIIGTIYDQEK